MSKQCIYKNPDCPICPDRVFDLSVKEDHFVAKHSEQCRRIDGHDIPESCQPHVTNMSTPDVSTVKSTVKEPQAIECKCKPVQNNGDGTQWVVGNPSCPVHGDSEKTRSTGGASSPSTWEEELPTDVACCGGCDDWEAHDKRLKQHFIPKQQLQEKIEALEDSENCMSCRNDCKKSDVLKLIDKEDR